MAINKIANGFYSFSDSYLKSMRKQDLINYIRTIEKNWQNSLITNDIQYANCKRLLAEERNKAIDEFKDSIKTELDRFGVVNLDTCVLYDFIDRKAEQLKAGGKNG